MAIKQQITLDNAVENIDSTIYIKKLLEDVSILEFIESVHLTYGKQFNTVLNPTFCFVHTTGKKILPYYRNLILSYEPLTISVDDGYDLDEMYFVESFKYKDRYITCVICDNTNKFYTHEKISINNTSNKLIYGMVF